MGAVQVGRRRAGEMMSNAYPDRMPDIAFRMMSATFALKDMLFPGVDKRVASFGIREGMTVVDYGCGPGRYTARLAKLVGPQGQVYAVDVQELAIEYVKRKMTTQGITNIIPVLARGYQTGIADHVADMVFALDMFFGVSDPVALLAEIHRILRPDGILILDDGHQPRAKTLEKVKRSGKWEIAEANRDYLRCDPK
jgi:ubiquinone/menaquinone biosynthesis C-methylase UbiE